MERRNAERGVHKDERLVVGEPASAAPVRFRSRIDCIPPRARTFDVSARTADVFAGGFRAGCAPSSFCKPLFSSIAGGTNSLMRRSVCSAEATAIVRCRSPSIASARGVNEVITPVARELPDAQVLDPTPILCPKDTCPARVNRIGAHTDYMHNLQSDVAPHGQVPAALSQMAQGAPAVGSAQRGVAMTASKCNRGKNAQARR
jgi:hypothetical protein